MRRSKLFRTILILALVGLALVYLYPTYHSWQLDEELDRRLNAIAEKTGMNPDVLREDIFRFDVSLAERIPQDTTVLTKAEREQVLAEIDDLRSDFYQELDEAQNGAIKLGLDLQGGMHLVLEVNLVELMANIAKNEDATFGQIMDEVRTRLDENPDLDFESVVMEAFQGRDVAMARYFGDPRQSDREILRELRNQAEEAIDLTLTKLRNRVDEFGVSEPSITKQGSRRIVVELPGVQDPTRARNLIGRTALLEFQIVAKQETAAEVLREIDSYLVKALEDEGRLDPSAGDELLPASGGEAEAGPGAEEGAAGEADGEEAAGTERFVGEGSTPEEPAAEAEAETAPLDRERPLTGLMSLYGRSITVLEQDRPRVERYLARSDVQERIPPDYEFLWGNNLEQGQGGQGYWTLHLVKERPEFTGALLSDAQVTIGSGGADPTQAGQPIVNLTLNREGARKFARVSEANVGRQLAIVLDEKVHMAPVIRTRIPDGRAIIEGSSSVEEASDLAIVLRAGALPAPVDIIEERTVGPSLGADSIRAGALSAILGLAMVMVFMVIYYRASGLIADLVLVLNMVFVFSVLGGFGFTLTLPGIAGIILTIGMAVDANVLIFERIREELVSGRSVWNSVKNGFDRATLTILDANVTTAIAAVVLYQFGTGPIKGFALTLMIGIAASVFTALVVSRAIFDSITARWAKEKLSI